MTPELALFDMTNVRGGDAVQARYNSASHNFMRKEVANLKDVFLSKYRTAVRRPDTVTVFRHHILDIISVSTKKKVVWVDALSVVAPMAHNQTFWNSCFVVERVRKSVSEALYQVIVSEGKPTVSVRPHDPGPFKATGWGWGTLGKEPPKLAASGAEKKLILGRLFDLFVAVFAVIYIHVSINKLIRLIFQGLNYCLEAHP